jgi:phosphate uptake regulator
MASDLRIIISSLNIITELERIGNYTVGTANIAIIIGNEPPL